MTGNGSLYPHATPGTVTPHLYVGGYTTTVSRQRFTDTIRLDRGLFISINMTEYFHGEVH